MKVIVHTPPPLENTYDLLGLTEEDMALLDALIGAVNAVGDAPDGSGLWRKIHDARKGGFRFLVKEHGGARSVTLSVWRDK